MLTGFFILTITERNQKLYELRERLLKARNEVAWIEQEIWLTNEKYKNQDLDLYQEMFGTNWYKLMAARTEPYMPSFEVYTRPHIFWFVVIKHCISLYKKLVWRSAHCPLLTSDRQTPCL